VLYLILIVSLTVATFSDYIILNYSNPFFILVVMVIVLTSGYLSSERIERLEISECALKELKSFSIYSVTNFSASTLRLTCFLCGKDCFRFYLIGGTFSRFSIDFTI
jgi:hypothetical protein